MTDKSRSEIVTYVAENISLIPTLYPDFLSALLMQHGVAKWWSNTENFECAELYHFLSDQSGAAEELFKVLNFTSSFYGTAELVLRSLLLNSHDARFYPHIFDNDKLPFENILSLVEGYASDAVLNTLSDEREKQTRLMLREKFIKAISDLLEQGLRRPIEYIIQKSPELMLRLLQLDVKSGNEKILEEALKSLSFDEHFELPRRLALKRLSEMAEQLQQPGSDALSILQDMQHVLDSLVKLYELRRAKSMPPSLSQLRECVTALLEQPHEINQTLAAIQEAFPDPDTLVVAKRTGLRAVAAAVKSAVSSSDNLLVTTMQTCARSLKTYCTMRVEEQIKLEELERIRQTRQTELEELRNTARRTVAEQVGLSAVATPVELITEDNMPQFLMWIVYAARTISDSAAPFFYSAMRRVASQTGFDETAEVADWDKPHSGLANFDALVKSTRGAVVEYYSRSLASYSLASDIERKNFPDKKDVNALVMQAATQFACMIARMQVSRFHDYSVENIQDNVRFIITELNNVAEKKFSEKQIEDMINASVRVALEDMELMRNRIPIIATTVGMEMGTPIFDEPNPAAAAVAAPGDSIIYRKLKELSDLLLSASSDENYSLAALTYKLLLQQVIPFMQPVKSDNQFSAEEAVALRALLIDRIRPFFDNGSKYHDIVNNVLGLLNKIAAKPGIENLITDNVLLHFLTSKIPEENERNHATLKKLHENALSVTDQEINDLRVALYKKANEFGPDSFAAHRALIALAKFSPITMKIYSTDPKLTFYLSTGEQFDYQSFFKIKDSDMPTSRHPYDVILKNHRTQNYLSIKDMDLFFEWQPEKKQVWIKNIKSGLHLPGEIIRLMNFALHTTHKDLKKAILALLSPNQTRSLEQVLFDSKGFSHMGGSHGSQELFSELIAIVKQDPECHAAFLSALAEQRKDGGNLLQEYFSHCCEDPEDPNKFFDWLKKLNLELGVNLANILDGLFQSPEARFILKICEMQDKLSLENKKFYNENIEPRIINQLRSLKLDGWKLFFDRDQEIVKNVVNLYLHSLKENPISPEAEKTPERQETWVALFAFSPKEITQFLLQNKQRFLDSLLLSFFGKALSLSEPQREACLRSLVTIPFSEAICRDKSFSNMIMKAIDASRTYNPKLFDDNFLRHLQTVNETFSVDLSFYRLKNAFLHAMQPVQAKGMTGFFKSVTPVWDLKRISDAGNFQALCQSADTPEKQGALVKFINDRVNNAPLDFSDAFLKKYKLKKEQSESGMAVIITATQVGFIAEHGNANPPPATAYTPEPLPTGKRQ